MTDLDNDIRTAIAQIAAEAGPGRGAETAQLAIARDRAQRRSRARAAGIALAVALAGIGLSAIAPNDTTGVSVAAPNAPGNGLYDLPTRGSLAQDAEFVAGVRDIDWVGRLGVDNAEAGPPPATRRVVFAGEVPGGARWAVVMGLIDTQQVWAWFIGGPGARPDDLTLAADPARGGASQRIALVDSRQPRGTLLVLGLPGDEAEYSPSLDRAATGALVRTFSRLPAVDGVFMGPVVTPLTADAGELHILRGQMTVVTLAPTTPSRLLQVPASSPSTGDPSGFGLRMQQCLQPLGYQVEIIGPDAYDILSGPFGPGPLSTAEQAQQETAERQCRSQLGY